MPVLPRPSFADIPPSDEWGLSEQEWKEVETKRSAFKRLPITRQTYVRHNGSLHPQDMTGFCAAGCFIWRLGPVEAEVLMAWEDRNIRNPTRQLNFLGGRRDAVNETPWMVAAREVDEETGELLSPQTIDAIGNPKNRAVVWIPESKYALYMHELTIKQDQDVAARFNTMPRKAKGGPLGVIGGDASIAALAWVRASDLRENSPANFAPFAQTMISALLRSGTLPFAS